VASPASDRPLNPSLIELAQTCQGKSTAMLHSMEVNTVQLAGFFCARFSLGK
jgi:hypothetical protein